MEGKDEWYHPAITNVQQPDRVIGQQPDRTKRAATLGNERQRLIRSKAGMKGRIWTGSKGCNRQGDRQA